MLITWTPVVRFHPVRPNGTLAQWLERKPDKLEVDRFDSVMSYHETNARRGLHRISSGLRECESHIRLLCRIRLAA